MNHDPGLLLRLAAPFMSFGEQTAFTTHRTTLPFPTRSAVIGLLASCLGRPREHALDPITGTDGQPHGFQDLALTVRVDRPGHLWTDYHTTGAGRPHKQGLPTSGGEYRAAKQSTHQSWRQYLTDAAFTLAVQGPAPLLAVLADALENPVFAPYLGRRCCPPSEPLVLADLVDDPIHHLLRHTPLTAPAPARARTVPVTFWWEQPPPDVRTPDRHRLVADTPLDFTPTTRHHQVRQIWSATHHLPAHLATGPDPIPALTAYLQDTGCTPR